MFDHNIKDIGLYTRPSTQGDELDLVEDFIEYYIHNFLVCQSYLFAIFRQTPSIFNYIWFNIYFKTLSLSCPNSLSFLYHLIYRK